MTFHPTQEQLANLRWFSREPLITIDTSEHVPFPMMEVDGAMVCLCRDCAPAEDVIEEDMIQVAYVKAIETFCDRYVDHKLV